MPPLRIIFVVNHVAFFVSHRLPIAIGARNAGYEVALITGRAGSISMEKPAELMLNSVKIPNKRVAFGSSTINPFFEFLGLVQLFWQIYKARPDLVHCASPKGLLYGGLAARLCGVKALVLAVSGMGFAYTNAGNDFTLRFFVAKVYRALVHLAYRHKNVRVIVQNSDDRAALINSGLASEHLLTLIPGSGVQLEDFIDAPICEKQPLVLFPARMLADKGVIEFVESARVLKTLAPNWRFVLAGAADYHNPTCLSLEQINAWQDEGIVEWLGHVEDMAPLFAKASIVCLPSYREGMPKSLLEAAAAGCAVITTNTTGCREAIIPGETGDLVPTRDSHALTLAIQALVNDRARRERYGHAGRRLAISRFGVSAVVDRTLEIYRELLRDG